MTMTKEKEDLLEKSDFWKVDHEVPLQAPVSVAQVHAINTQPDQIDNALPQQPAGQEIDSKAPSPQQETPAPAQIPSQEEKPPEPDQPCPPGLGEVDQKAPETPPTDMQEKPLVTPLQVQPGEQPIQQPRAEGASAPPEGFAGHGTRG